MITFPRAPVISHFRAVDRSRHHAGGRGHRRVVHDPAALRAADPADRSRRPQPQGLPAAAAYSERSEFAGARHARHAGQRRTVPADGVDRAVRADSRGSRRRAQARSARRGRQPDGRTEPVSRCLGDAVLGRRRSDFRARGGGPRRRCAGRRSGFRCRRASRRSATAVARLLVQNNEAEEATAVRVSTIYAQVHRQVYWFVAATLTTILLTSLYLIRFNRRLFAELGSLSDERRELAQQLIATREVHAARDLARAARRARPGADGDRIHARARRPPGAGRVAAAGRPARGPGDRAGRARQRARPVADAAPLGARGRRARRHG